MLVVDASCLYEVVVDGVASEAVRDRLALDADHAAPHVVDVEVLSVIRRDHRGGIIDATAASQAVADLRDWPGERFDHRLLLDRAWNLRDNIRSWEALYVALAEVLGATLITRDRRLGSATGPVCAIEVISER